MRTDWRLTVSLPMGMGGGGVSGWGGVSGRRVSGQGGGGESGWASGVFGQGGTGVSGQGGSSVSGQGGSGVSGQGVVCLVRRVSVWGGVARGCVWSGGGAFTPCGQTDACENITFSTLLRNASR